MKILLLSPYQAHSHRIWCEQLCQQFGDYQWQILSLPPRYFSWRIRGNGFYWWCTQKDVLNQDYDLLIATSMTDLNSLYGFFPNLAQVPSVLYFHENQFDYPQSENALRNVEPQIVQLYAAVSATRVVFNSQYNQSSFLTGIENLLEKLPEKFPSSLIDQLKDKSQVLPVPLGDEIEPRKIKPGETFSIGWNHRWEYDKWPECFHKALEMLAEKNIPFHLYVLGQQFRNSPVAFEQMHEKFAKNIKHWGWVEQVEDYRRILSNCHVVVSTALHDFQGLAMLEAAALGVFPLVPNRLAYPEWFEGEFRYASIPDDIDMQAHALADSLERLYQDNLRGSLRAKTELQWLRWSQLCSSYRQLFEELVNESCGKKT